VETLFFAVVLSLNLLHYWISWCCSIRTYTIIVTFLLMHGNVFQVVVQYKHCILVLL